MWSRQLIFFIARSILTLSLLLATHAKNDPPSIPGVIVVTGLLIVVWCQGYNRSPETQEQIDFVHLFAEQVNQS